MARRTRVGRAPIRRDFGTEIDHAVRGATGQGAVTAEGWIADRREADSRVVRFLHTDSKTIPSGEPWVTFRGDVGDVHAVGRTLLVGVGPRNTGIAAIEDARAAGTAAGARLESGSYFVETEDHLESHVQPLIDGLANGYGGSSPVILQVEPHRLRQAERGLLAADVSRLARAISNAPAAVVTPARAAAWAVDVAKRSGLVCTVLGPEAVAADGFGALTAIGGGSQNGPHLVQLRYTPENARHRISLVGKGVTFDSGGLSLKSPAAMQPMRLDVTGAATVLAVMAGLRRMGCPNEVHAILPFAENLPGPGASRPGDVIEAWDGTQIQLLDLDFEGRVILADALALACSESPDLVIDIATLTYQSEIALGPEIGAVIGRDEGTVRHVLDAAARAGEPAWPLPWAPRYLDQVRTAFGVRNHPLQDTGRALTAALFLGEFVPDDIPWAHLDMTGPAWRGDASIDGATGYGTRTLMNLCESL